MSHMPGNSTLTALKAKAQPLFDKEEKARKAGLNPTEKMKEEGDELYKQAKFEEVRAYAHVMKRANQRTDRLRD